MRAAVHDRFWSTGGGGERFAAGIAQALAVHHQVELFSVEPLDLAALSERLSVDLRGVTVRIIGDDLDAVQRESADLDLFVNASYLSSERSSAARSIYVVHFPAALHGADDWRRRASRVVDERTRALRLPVTGVAGLHPSERIGRHSVRWTDGQAIFEVEAPPAVRSTVRVVLGRYLPGGHEPVEVEVLVDGRAEASRRLAPRRSRLDRRTVEVVEVPVVGHPDGSPVVVEVRSPSFRPSDAGAADLRRLGVPVIDVVAGTGPVPWLAGHLPAVWEGPLAADFLETYDMVLSNSAFTAEWVRRLWAVDSRVLHPPVTMFEPAAKEPVVLSVGRFFREGGHSKKQLELVRAFRRLVDTGVEGWELHLAGGCAPAAQPYLDEVRAAAEGLPVQIHVDLTGAELAALYGRASIYWHATGIGEDPRRHPEKFEHFGITTAEAMSAGAVPVVIGQAGQLEIVEHGRTGLHFHDLDELVAHTRSLVDDPDRLAAMSAAARAAARRYSVEAFAERLDGYVSELGG